MSRKKQIKYVSFRIIVGLRPEDSATTPLDRLDEAHQEDTEWRNGTSVRDCSLR